MYMPRIAIVGGGLAGCECALYLAERGFAVTLLEQRPLQQSPAHVTAYLGELVCSNSFRSQDITSGIGLLKQELRELNSALMAIADTTSVPAGKALAVDRQAFAAAVTDAVLAHPRIHREILCVDSLDDPAIALADSPDAPGFERVVIAAGPMAAASLSASLAAVVGNQHLYFYDAIAPIVAGDSIDLSIAFWGSRYAEPGEGDYLNCPMNEAEYRLFYDALVLGDKVAAHAGDAELHFEGCMPIEALAARGDRTLTFGPLKPVGFVDPRTGRRPYALLQLRPENNNKTMFNLVGCQTKLTYPEQDRIFRLVPGLAQTEFVRYGSMHRNTYVNAPKTLSPALALNTRPRVHLAGQITGVEGYVESMACGLWAGMCVEALEQSLPLTPPPPTTALGALLNHLATPVKNFQPSNANFGLMTEPAVSLKKKDRKLWYSDRARADFAAWMGGVTAR